MTINKVCFGKTEINQAVILAGGRGERLRPFTDNMPKPMAPVLGRPFLEHLINMLKENGIQEAVLLTGYLGEKIEEYFGNGEKFGVNIKYSRTPFLNEKGEENESGMRLKNAENILNDKFLLMYCDNYWPLNLRQLSNFYEKQNVLTSVVVYTNKDEMTKNNVLVDYMNRIMKYDKSRQDEFLNGVDIGFFIIDKKIFQMFPKDNFQFERDIIPRLVAQKQIVGFLTDSKYYSISTPERIKLTEKFLRPKKVIFLDRDGVINKKAGRADYIKKWEEFEFLPGVVEGMKILCENKYDIYVVSNQPGVARGIMTENDLCQIHDNLKAELARSGVNIKNIYCCLHGWHDNCECRKPKAGLLFQAARENNLDLSKVVFIGDDIRDILAGEAAGCKTVLIEDKSFLEIVKELAK